MQQHLYPHKCLPTCFETNIHTYKESDNAIITGKCLLQTFQLKHIIKLLNLYKIIRAFHKKSNKSGNVDKLQMFIQNWKSFPSWPSNKNDDLQNNWHHKEFKINCIQNLPNKIYQQFTIILVTSNEKLQVIFGLHKFHHKQWYWCTTRSEFK